MSNDTSAQWDQRQHLRNRQHWTGDNDANEEIAHESPKRATSGDSLTPSREEASPDSTGENYHLDVSLLQATPQLGFLCKFDGIGIFVNCYSLYVDIAL